jgi:predicted nucleotidyltransferase
VLRDNVRHDSDIDVLVTFDDAAWGLLGHVQMQQERAAVLGRPIISSPTVLEQRANAIRREAIPDTAQVIYRVEWPRSLKPHCAAAPEGAAIHTRPQSLSRLLTRGPGHPQPRTPRHTIAVGP